MFTIEEHIESLINHISKVRNNCLLLGKKFIKNGNTRMGIDLIARGHIHDITKFRGTEWEHLHRGENIPKDKIQLAINHHASTNDHHPEYHDGFENMPKVAIAELAADWLARSQEFGSDIKIWIRETAISKFKLIQVGKIISFLCTVLVC